MSSTNIHDKEYRQKCCPKISQKNCGIRHRMNSEYEKDNNNSGVSVLAVNNGRLLLTRSTFVLHRRELEANRVHRARHRNDDRSRDKRRFQGIHEHREGRDAGAYGGFDYNDQASLYSCHSVREYIQNPQY